jgi:S1-C subfamily serine protease
MQAAAEQFSWKCPTCGRTVPRKVTACRCGFRQRAAGSVTPEPSRLKLLLVVLIGTAALGLRSFFAPAAPPPATAAPAAVSPTLPATGPAATPADAPTAHPAVPPAALPPTTSSSLDAAPASLFVQPVAARAAGESATAVTPLEDVVAAAIPAVAAIQAGSARGTGFFVRPDTVLTNAHVVEGHTTVQLQAGTAKYTARVVSTSTATDLALLQVSNANPAQATLRLGSIERARVGQEVVAIGSALGVLSNTVTRGIVSAVRRAGDVTLIQTDAAINPGNSGGPLLDRTGQVIGINTMKVLARAESIGFAVAIDHAAALLTGQPAAVSTSSPAAGLDTMLRQGGASQTDDARSEGQQAYERAMAATAQRAGQIDDYWQRYAPTCVSASSNAGDRRWLAALQDDGVRLATNSRVNCREWLDAVSSNARTVDQEIREANEIGRRAGVFPGVMRDTRRRHRLDWPGWD